MKFNELEIKQEILKAIEDIGFTAMTPIQESVIPAILEKEDVIGQAQTGTGKTAAFGIPILEGCSTNNKFVEHIIISPTRELATQIKNELILLAKYLDVKIGLVLGGVSYNEEYRMLKTKPNIIVATPGRLLDHLKTKKLDISNIKTLTLDEADEMLNIGFKEELTAIVEFMPENRQSLLFSATLSKDVLDIANKFLNEPLEFLVSSGLNATNSVDQYAIICDEKEKFSILTRLIEVEKPQSAIIFGRTKRRSDELARALNSVGIKAKALHGDLSQKERTTTMDAFKKQEFNFLVATDVAARGIHVDGIEVVYNFDLPQEIEYYVHRIGRTGRAGLNGKSISFLRQSELEHLYLIEKKSSAKIKVINPPTLAEVKTAKKDYAKDLILQAINSGDALRHYEIAKQIISEFGDVASLAAALELLIPKIDTSEINLSSEPPVRVKFINKNSKGSSNKKYYSSKNSNSKEYNQKKNQPKSFGQKDKNFTKKAFNKPKNSK